MDKEFNVIRSENHQPKHGCENGRSKEFPQNAHLLWRDSERKVVLWKRTFEERMTR